MVFAKSKGKNIINRCHKNFDNKKFEEELKEHLFSVLNFDSFHSTLKTTLRPICTIKAKGYAKQQSTLHDKNPL